MTTPTARERAEGLTRYTQPVVQTHPAEPEFRVSEVPLVPDKNGKWVKFEDVESAILQARDEGLEEGAKVADKEADTFSSNENASFRDGEFLKAKAIATAIRSLKSGRGNEQDAR